MLYEFAITPDIFDQVENRGLEDKVKQFLRGLCSDGLVADVDKGKLFSEIANNLVPALPHKIRHDVMNLLSTLHDRHRIVKYPKFKRRPGTPLNWLEAIVDLHLKHPFYGVLHAQEKLPSEFYKIRELLNIEEYLDSDKWNTRRRTVTLKRTVDNYRLILKPAIRHARRVELIDPFMSCRDPKFMKIVDTVFELAADRHNPANSLTLHIHAGNPERNKGSKEPVDKRLNAWKNALEPRISEKNLSVTVLLWDVLVDSEKFHDRFIATDQCGISIQGGLDCLPNSSTIFMLLDEEDRRRWLEAYNPANPSTPYDLMGKVKLGI